MTWDNNLEIGNVYGRLKIIAFSHKRNGGKHYKCLCTCGKEVTVYLYSLRNGDTKSCGCYHDERSKLNGANFYRHGNRLHPLYRTWYQMLQRCENVKHISYKYYGARGISVCEEWHDFKKFYSDMGDKPSLNHSLDRIDNNGNYEKRNCRWATAKIQARNKRIREVRDANSVHTNGVLEHT